MITLRTYSNAAAAAMAKSLLDDRQIVCSLADENVNLYGGGPLTMPIRLLVAEEQAEEAGHVLDDARPVLPEGFVPEDEPPSKTEELKPDFLAELEKLRRSNRWIVGIVAVLLVITLYLVKELPRRTPNPWSKVDQAYRVKDYKRALDLAKRIVADYPGDYYGHEYLGEIYSQLEDWAQAEAEFTRAYDLWPPQSLQGKLKTIRERRGEKLPRQSPAAR